MAISLVNFMSERLRQGMAGGDNKFFKQYTMFFELRVPQEMSFLANATFLFPLIVTPDTYNLSEPFTVEATPTQGAGLYVEENGIVQRVIRISGTTGFKPRKLHSSGTAVLMNASPYKKSYSRGLPGSRQPSLRSRASAISNTCKTRCFAPTRISSATPPRQRTPSSSSTSPR